MPPVFVGVDRRTLSRSDASSPVCGESTAITCGRRVLDVVRVRRPTRSRPADGRSPNLRDGRSVYDTTCWPGKSDRVGAKNRTGSSEATAGFGGCGGSGLGSNSGLRKGTLGKLSLSASKLGWSIGRPLVGPDYTGVALTSNPIFGFEASSLQCIFWRALPGPRSGPSQAKQTRMFR